MMWVETYDFPFENNVRHYIVDTMSVPTEFHSTLCRTYSALCKSVHQPITEVKAEWNVAADVPEIGTDECVRVNSHII